MPNVHSGDKKKESHHGCGYSEYSELSLTANAGCPPWRWGGGRWGHFNRISSLILNSNQRASFNLFLLVVGQGWGSEIESISDANDGICDCEEVLSGSENATLGN